MTPKKTKITISATSTPIRMSIWWTLRGAALPGREGLGGLGFPFGKLGLAGSERGFPGGKLRFPLVCRGLGVMFGHGKSLLLHPV